MSLRHKQGSGVVSGAGSVVDDRAPVWHVDRQGHDIGPLSALELALAAKSGLLEASDCIWRAGLSRWYRASEVVGLLHAGRVVGAAVAHSGTSTQTLPSGGDDHLSARVDRPDPAHRAMAERWWDTALPGAHMKSATPAARARPEAPRQPNRSRSFAEPVPSTEIDTAAGARDATPAPTPTSEAQSRQLPALIPPTALVAEQMGNSVTERIADAVARQIIAMLERNEIRNLDDLSTDERLIQLAQTVYSALPGSIRGLASGTVGRPFVEARIFDILVSLRASISPQTRAEDLRVIILERTPHLARAIDAAAANVMRSASAAVTASWNAALATFKRPALFADAGLVAMTGGASLAPLDAPTPARELLARR